MANIKSFWTQAETSKTFYLRIRNSSGDYHDPADSTFKAISAGIVNPCLEDADEKGLYTWTGGSAQVWADGTYYITLYRQVGGSPSLTLDEPRGSNEVYFKDDEEITLLETTAPTTQEIDVQLTASHGAGSWQPPDLSAIALEASVQDRPTLSQIEGSAVLAKDATVAKSSVCTETRLAELDAVNLPGNIDAIKAKTDNLPTSPANEDTLLRVLGLSYENMYTHTRVYDVTKVQSAKVDLYDSKANAITHDGVTGIVAKYTQTFTYFGDNIETMVMVRDV